MTYNNNYSNRNTGIGFLGALTVLFIALKLLDVINWSWWWVLSPIIIPTIVVVSLFIIFSIVYHLKKLLNLLDKIKNL